MGNRIPRIEGEITPYHDYLQIGSEALEETNGSDSGSMVDRSRNASTERELMSFNKVIRSLWVGVGLVAAIAFLLWSVRSEGAQPNCIQLHDLAAITGGFANDAAVARAHDGNLIIAEQYRTQARKAGAIARSAC